MGLSGDLAVWSAESDGPPLREITLGALLDEQAEAHGDRDAFIFDATGTRWSYAELKRRADALARGLIAWGVAPGDRVAVLAPNCPEWLLMEYALAKTGATLVTVNPALREGELAYVLRQSGTSALVSVAEYRGHDIAACLARLRGDLPALARVAMLGGVPANAPDGAEDFAALAPLGASVPEGALAARQAAVRPGDVAQIQYTSGTTGAPKGARLTHRGIVNNARLMAARGGFVESDVLVSAMPFFHTAGCVCNAIGMLAAGGCLVTMPAFDAGEMLEAIERHRGTITNAVPTMLIRMEEDPSFATRDLSSWRILFTGGTNIPAPLMRRLCQQLGAEPMIIMGMTECSPIITQTNPSDDFETRLASAGTPLSHTELRIVDPDSGAPVRLGESGELQIRGYLVTAGYHDMPDKTAEAIDGDGWLHSGDLAVLEPGGHLRIVGRLKDMLIRGGENIYPAEIEAHLMAHLDVSDAQVVGVPDAEMGEEVFAFVVPRPGARPDPKALQDHCRAGMARHKMPKYVEIVEAFPQTANGKVRKVELREMAARLVREGAA